MSRDNLYEGLIYGYLVIISVCGPSYDVTLTPG